MRTVQLRPHPATPAPSDTAATDAAGPRVWDDMTVEVALSVMAGARTERLLVCDDDGQGTRVVTQAQLTAVRAGSTYTDQARLREIPGGSDPFASPRTAGTAA